MSITVGFIVGGILGCIAFNILKNKLDAKERQEQAERDIKNKKLWKELDECWENSPERKRMRETDAKLAASTARWLATLEPEEQEDYHNEMAEYRRKHPKPKPLWMD